MESSNVTLVASAVNPLLFGRIQRGGVNDNFVQIEFFAVPDTASGDPTREFLYFISYRKELTVAQATNSRYYLQKWNQEKRDFDPTFDLETNFDNELLRPLSRTRGSTKIDGYIATKYVRVPNSAYKAALTTK